MTIAHATHAGFKPETESQAIRLKVISRPLNSAIHQQHKDPL